MVKKHPLERFVFCPQCGSNSFDINDGKSKRCDDCGFVYYLNPVAATVAIIENKQGEILVATRSKEPAKGTFDLPGGFIDMHETAEEAIRREVAEETGLIVDSIKYLFSLPNVYPFSDFEIHVVDLFFLCKVSNFDSLKAQDDVAKLQFIPKDKLNPADFGLASIRKGVKKLLNLSS